MSRAIATLGALLDAAGAVLTQRVAGMPLRGWLTQAESSGAGAHAVGEHPTLDASTAR